MTNSQVQPDKEVFSIIWDFIIKQEIERYNRRYLGNVELVKNAADRVRNEYWTLNKHCKTKYMKHEDGRIDRHKVAACYIIAICNVRPLSLVGADPLKDEVFFSLNERLAITTGLSILRAYMEEELAAKEGEDEAKTQKILSKLKNGIYIPGTEEVRHGHYLNNYATELHFGTEENRLSILSLAHELYLLELLTRKEYS